MPSKRDYPKTVSLVGRGVPADLSAVALAKVEPRLTGDGAKCNSLGGSPYPRPRLRNRGYQRSFRPILFGVAFGGALLLAGCYTNPAVAVFDTGSQLQVRSYQTRAFETADREKTLRAIIATMQDLGFVIDKADATLGSVSGTKLASYELRMTATVRPRGTTQLLVRVSAQGKPKPTAAAKPIEDPAPYRDFFAALSKSLFLEAQQVD
jgi:hypothetical protein